MPNKGWKQTSGLFQPSLQTINRISQLQVDAPLAHHGYPIRPRFLTPKFLNLRSPLSKQRNTTGSFVGSARKLHPAQLKADKRDTARAQEYEAEQTRASPSFGLLAWRGGENARGMELEENTDPWHAYHSASTKHGRSKFCMLPRGLSGTPPGFVRSLFSGCIPVLLSDEFEIPFQNLLIHDNKAGGSRDMSNHRHRSFHESAVNFAIKWPMRMVTKDLGTYVRQFGAAQEAKNRPNIDWQDKIHREILWGLRNISETP